ncbi:PH domain-containing protein [Arthrobacter cheniae]|uniref:PH domain-containing protein n=1 Tax=Arthrobacter cheniae TaxID=1258888 RepID=A0A3A5MF03_9MICC|nr:PH domain-containing protein [Arthrobacter cheniae]RJT80872.1 PH domain-containing protein [Arthrobacter cheniae]
MRIKLLPGERVLVRTRPTPLPLVGPVIAGFLLLAVGGFSLGFLAGRDVLGLGDWRFVLFAAALGVVVLLLLRVVVRPLVRWSSNRYVLTSMRLIHRRGAARRSEHQINLSAISQLQTEQGLLQRLVGSGTLIADLGFDRAHAYRDVPQIATFKEYVVQAISDLPLTRMFDGVDMEIDPQYARGSMVRAQQEWARQEWAQQEWRGGQS